MKGVPLQLEVVHCVPELEVYLFQDVDRQLLDEGE